MLDFIGLKQTGVHEVFHRDKPVGRDGETTHVHPVLEFPDVEGGEGLGPAVQRVSEGEGEVEGGGGDEWVKGRNGSLHI
jgi:hypothetical protein